VRAARTEFCVIKTGTRRPRRTYTAPSPPPATTTTEHAAATSVTIVVVVVVRHRDRDRRQQDAVVERVDVPPMVESVLDVRRSGKILPTAVRSNEKAVIFGFGLWHQRRRRQWRQGHGHGTPANVHRVFRASTAPAHR